MIDLILCQKSGSPDLFISTILSANDPINVQILFYDLLILDHITVGIKYKERI